MGNVGESSNEGSIQRFDTPLRIDEILDWPEEASRDVLWVGNESERYPATRQFGRIAQAVGEEAGLQEESAITYLGIILVRGLVHDDYEVYDDQGRLQDVRSEPWFGGSARSQPVGMTDYFQHFIENGYISFIEVQEQADKFMLYNGVFPEHIRRRHGNSAVDLYRQWGRFLYSQLAHFSREDFPTLSKSFRALSEQYDPITGILEELLMPLPESQRLLNAVHRDALQQDEIAEEVAQNRADLFANFLRRKQKVLRILGPTPSSEQWRYTPAEREDEKRGYERRKRAALKDLDHAGKQSTTELDQFPLN